MSQWYLRKGEQLTISLYVQPGAKQSEVVGLHGDALKIRLAAPPIEGRANKALLAFISRLFAVPPSQTALKRGGSSRHKVVLIQGSQVDPKTLLFGL